jgi:hypothetical protein
MTFDRVHPHPANLLSAGSPSGFPCNRTIPPTFARENIFIKAAQAMFHLWIIIGIVPIRAAM